MRTVQSAIVILCALAVGFIPGSRADTWPGDTPVPYALGGVLTDAGMATIADEIASMFTVATVEEMIMGMNPIYEDQFSLELPPFGDLAFVTIAVDVTNVNFTEPIQLDANIRPAGVEITGAIQNLRIDLHAYGVIEFLFFEDDFSVSGYLEAQSANISGLILLWVAEHLSTVYVDMTNVDVTFTGFNLDISGIPSELVDFIEGYVEDAIRDALIDAIQTEIPPALQDLLNSLPYSFDFEIMGILMTFYTNISGIQFNEQAMTLWLEADMVAEGADPCGPVGDGSYFTPTDPPAYYGSSPGGLPYEFALTISDDAINRILWSAVNAGLLCYTVDADFLMELGFPYEITSEFFAALVPRLHDYAQAAPMIIQIRPQEAPIVTINSYGSEYIIELSMQDLYMDFYIFAMDRWLRLFTFDGDIDYAALNLYITVDNAIHIGISDDVSLTTTVIYDELLQLTDEERAAIESILPAILQILLPLITESIEDIPLPTFEGYGIEVLELSPHGSAQNHDYIGLFGNLIIQDDGTQPGVILLDKRAVERPAAGALQALR